MIRQAFKRLWNDKRGNALLIAGAAMPLVIGSAGLGADTIQWALWKRQLQRAADSAAISGVYAKMQGQNLAGAVATDITKHNQTGIALYEPATVSEPAVVGTEMDPVAVRLRIQKRLSFSSMFLASPPIIEANATAAAIPTGEYCGQAQINTNETGISAGGSVVVDLKCGLITNSTSIEAAVAFGASKVTASPVAAVGGLDKTDNWTSGTTLLPFTLAQPDPFADINAPAIPASCSNFSDNPQDIATFPAVAPTDPTALQTNPVCFNNFTLKGDLTLRPGTYVVTGDMKINSGAKLNCTGCTFIMTNSTPSETGTVDINGGAQLNLVAPDDGTYKGILFFSDRGADPADINKINGNATSFFKGAFYFPHQEVEYTGNAGVTYECIKLVTWKMTFLGNAAINNNCPANWYGNRFKGRHVRLIA